MPNCKLKIDPQIMQITRIKKRDGRTEVSRLRKATPSQGSHPSLPSATPWQGGRETEVGKRQRSEIRGQTSEDRHRERTFGNLRFRSTFDIIEAAERGLLPDKIMLNTHPQRWDDRFGPWVKELVWQNVKNVAKRVIVRRLPQYDLPDLRGRR